MAHNIPATILGIMAGAGVSIASGALLGSYVVTGVTPAYAEPSPPRIRAERVAADEDTWPAPDYMTAVSRPGDASLDTADLDAAESGALDQDWGVRAWGSSRL